MKNKEIVNIFPEALGIYKIEYNENFVKNYILNLEYKETFDTTGSNKKDSNCFISVKGNILSGLDKLKEDINKCVSDYLNNIYGYEIKPQIIDSWATKTKTEGVSQEHFHCHSLISGVFYLTKGSFRLTRPTIDYFWKLKVKENNFLNGKTLDFNIDSGTLLLFKSFLNHKIIKHEYTEDRYSIAFNVVPEGIFGGETSLISFGKIQ